MQKKEPAMSAGKKERGHTILFIEDRQQRCDLIRVAFARAGTSVRLAFAASPAAAFDVMNRETVDAVFFKQQASGTEGSELLRGLRENNGRDIAIIMITGQGDEHRAPQALEDGANDCVAGDADSIETFPLVAERAVAMMKNIVELRQLKEQLHHTWRLAAIGSLVPGLAHDINNALTSTLAYAELLGMKAPGEDVTGDVNRIVEGVERCKKIVDNLMDFSREQALTKGFESINTIADRAIDLRAYWLKSGGIEVVRDYDPDSTVFIDALEVQHAVLHLLVNAEQAVTRAGQPRGRITVTTRYNKEDRTVSMRIADNGPGIPPGVIAKIFDPFFTTQPPGTACGLGLFIVRGIITEHGGTIRVENPGGGGAAFTFMLPAGADKKS
jgi:signal transduction histidine kinase